MTSFLLKSVTPFIYNQCVFFGDLNRKEKAKTFKKKEVFSQVKLLILFFFCFVFCKNRKPSCEYTKQKYNIKAKSSETHTQKKILRESTKINVSNGKLYTHFFIKTIVLNLGQLHTYLDILTRQTLALTCNLERKKSHIFKFGGEKKYITNVFQKSTKASPWLP